VLRVPRIPPCLDNRGNLLRVTRGERHLVTVVAEEARKRRPPRPRADDDRSHNSVLSR